MSVRVSKISHAHYLCIDLQYTIYFKCTVYVQAENTYQNMCLCVRGRVSVFKIMRHERTYKKRDVHTRVFI